MTAELTTQPPTDHAPKAPPHAAVWVHRVSKWFGPVIALNDVSLCVEGGIVGLVGPNGAGKSTLLKLLTGQLRPSIGRVRIFGRSVRSPVARARIGYSPDVDAFYEEMTGAGFVEAMLRLSGYAASEAKERTAQALATVGMTDGRADKRLRGMSKGMRQRIKLAQAIAHEPDLLVLDEPLSGLDPVGRREFSDMIRAQAERGAAVLLSSHVLAELRDLADRIVSISDGKLLAEQSRGEFDRPRDEGPREIVVESPNAREIAQLAFAWQGVVAVELDETDDRRAVLRARDAGAVLDEIGRLCRERRIAVERLYAAERWSDALFGHAGGG